MRLHIFTVSVFCSLLSHVYSEFSDPPKCGGDIFVGENDGNITSPNYPMSYPSRTRCEWVLSAPDDMQIILKFRLFQLEERTERFNECVDFVEIRNGGRSNSPMIGVYCGKETPHDVRSTGNELSVKFKSDRYGEYIGFVAVYSRESAVKGENRKRRHEENPSAIKPYGFEGKSGPRGADSLQRPKGKPGIYGLPGTGDATGLPENDSFVAEVKTIIPTKNTTYSPGSEISIQCNVTGYPDPQVVWLKDKIPIISDGRISMRAWATWIVIQDNSRIPRAIGQTWVFQLKIRYASINDSGKYTCLAENIYSSTSSLITISVEDIYHRNCNDHPFFTNCKQIVLRKFCTHQYYAHYCCRSCTLDGQLPEFGDHLNFAIASNKSPDNKF